MAIMLMAPIYASATVQTPDEIRIGESVYPLCMRPILASYFAQHPDYDVVQGASEKFQPCVPTPDEELPDEVLQEVWTNLWRGYIASFAFVDDRLVVEEIWTHIFGWGEEWTPVIKCAMPESESRYLDWFSGPLYYLQIDQVENSDEEREEYSIFQVDVEKGRLVGSKKLKSEIHGPSSGIHCSAGYDDVPVEEPIIFHWCTTDSPSSSQCVDEESD
jgi:hypothetical protein